MCMKCISLYQITGINVSLRMVFSYPVNTRFWHISHSLNICVLSGLTRTVFSVRQNKDIHGKSVIILLFMMNITTETLYVIHNTQTDLQV